MVDKSNLYVESYLNTRLLLNETDELKTMLENLFKKKKLEDIKNVSEINDIIKTINVARDTLDIIDKSLSGISHKLIQVMESMANRT